MFGASNNKGLTGNKIKKAIISDSLCDPALNSYASTHGRSNIIYALRVADIGHMITGGGGDSTNLGGGSEEIINTSLTTTGNEIVDDLLNNNELFRDSLLSIIPEFKELFYYTGNGSLSLEQYETAIVPLLSLENLMFGLMQQDANSLIDLTESNSGGSNTIVNWYKTNNPYEFLSATSRINSGELITNYQTANKCLYIASCPSGNTHNGMKEYFSEIGNYFGNIQRYELEDEYMSVSKFYVDTFNLNEWHIYGSSRLGVYNANLNLVNVYFHADTSNHDFTNVNVQNTYVASPNYNLFSLERGAKRYELSNWLGNVNVVLTDKRVPVCNADTVTYFTADVVSANDYSPFGAPLAGRTWYSDTISQYRFAFNGKENDNETKTQDYGMRIYSGQLGKFLSPDPLSNDYPWLTPYQFASNMPINSIDMDGLENQTATNGKVYSGPYNMQVVNASIEANINNNNNRAMGSTVPYSLPSLMLNTYAGGVGVSGVQASNVRADYSRKVSKLEPLKATNPLRGSQLRNEYVTEARTNTPQPFREIASDMKPNLKPNPSGRFWVTNPGVNQTMQEIGAVSKGVLMLGVANSAYNIITAEDKIQATGQEVTIWGASYVGGQVGGEAGSIFGPWGAGIGTVTGAVIGGMTAASGQDRSSSTNVTPPVIPQDNTTVVTPNP